MMDSSTFKKFSANVDNILENLEDVDFTALGTVTCLTLDDIGAIHPMCCLC